MAAPTFDAVDHRHMARALALAARGLHTTAPNPRVGCVIVRNDVVVGEGWHVRAGEPHAEVHALRAAAGNAQGATAYVTLEPCSHFGRTPPCADALVAAGVGRVVAAMVDPNPDVAGRGLERLRAAGVAVASGLLADAAQELNVGFVSRMTRGRPWVRLKAAASLDGRTALTNGVSQWITGPAARRDGHRWRARACALLSGIGTVRQDDPRLDVREVPCARQPLRVIVDSRLQLSPQTRLFAAAAPVLIVAAECDAGREEALRAAGAEVICLPDGAGRVDLPGLLRELGRRGINELHVEAGGRLNAALLTGGFVDEFLFYLAPTLIGDPAQGLFVGGQGLSDLAGQQRLRIIDLRQVGADIRIIARPA